MKHLISIIFLCIYFVSCSSNPIIVGKYDSNKYTNSLLTQLELNSDSTYYFLKRYEWPIAESKGQWKMINKNLIELDEFYDLENLPISVNEKHLKEIDSIEFNINIPSLNMNPNSLDCYAYELSFDGRFFTNQSNRIIKIPKAKGNFDSFSIRIFFSNDICSVMNIARSYVSTGIYNRKNKDSNYFEITIPFENYMFNGISIKSDTLIFNGKDIYWNKYGNFEKLEK